MVSWRGSYLRLGGQPLFGPVLPALVAEGGSGENADDDAAHFQGSPGPLRLVPRHGGGARDWGGSGGGSCLFGGHDDFL